MYTDNWYTEYRYMRYTIADNELRAMDADETYVARRFDKVLHRAFRRVMGLIRAADDQRDLRAFTGLRLEKLAGNRKGQHSMRLNDQFRLIVRFVQDPQGQSIVVIEIVDYH
jgi:toxin HigB-1